MRALHIHSFIASLLAAIAVPVALQATSTISTAQLDEIWVAHLLWRAQHETISIDDREATLRAALFARPTDNALLAELARTYRDANNTLFEKAVIAYKRLLPSHQGRVETQNKATLPELADDQPETIEAIRSLFAERRFDEAEQALRIVLRDQPDNETALDLLGQCYLIQSEYAMGGMIYALLSERRPDNAAHANHLAYSFEQIEELELALSSLLRFVDQPAYDPNTFANILLLAGRLNRKETAEQIIEEWLRQDPQHPQAWTQHAHLHLFLGNLDKAQSSATKASGLAPDDPAPVHYLLEIALRRNDTEKARAHAEQLRNLLSDDVYNALVEQGRLPEVP